jgi:hypothetical protein
MAARKVLPTPWPAWTVVRLFSATDMATAACSDQRSMPSTSRAQPTGSLTYGFGSGSMMSAATSHGDRAIGLQGQVSHRPP